MSENNEPFMDAAKSDNIVLLQSLVDSGFDVNCRDEVNSTALHYACAEGRKAAVELLLSNRADVNAMNDFNETPLHNASSKGHIEIVQLLLDRNANKDIQTDDGWTALHLAAEKGHPNVVKILIRSGANVSIKDKGGADAAGYASHPEIIEEIATVASSTEPVPQSALDSGVETTPPALISTQLIVDVPVIVTEKVETEVPAQVVQTEPVDQHDSGVLLETINLQDEDEAQGESDKNSVTEAPVVSGTEASLQCCAIS